MIDNTYPSSPLESLQRDLFNLGVRLVEDAAPKLHDLVIAGVDPVMEVQAAKDPEMVARLKRCLGHE